MYVVLIQNHEYELAREHSVPKAIEAPAFSVIANKECKDVTQGYGETVVCHSAYERCGLEISDTSHGTLAHSLQLIEELPECDN